MSRDERYLVVVAAIIIADVAAIAGFGPERALGYGLFVLGSAVVVAGASWVIYRGKD